MANFFDFLSQFSARPSERTVNLGNSAFWTDGTRRNVALAAQPSPGFWDTILTKGKNYLTDPENLFKLGIGGLGAYAGYRSAKSAEDMMKRRQRFEEQAYRNQAARIAAADAELAKYNDPRAYASARKAVSKPVVNPVTGEVLYFQDNQLTGEQLPDGAKTIFAANGGPIGYVGGGTTGQGDKIPAMLSDGEFVVDADTVAALGDGNNAAGASALEQMRQNIRKHKRSAPVSKIPPKAKKPEQYLKGVKNNG